jgi:hypothetical protein
LEQLAGQRVTMIAAAEKKAYAFIPADVLQVGLLHARSNFYKDELYTLKKPKLTPESYMYLKLIA